jgi:hypothetical protein
MAFLDIPQGGLITTFDESLVALRHSFLNYKPTWGISEIRYDTEITGTGAAADEVNGEFLLSTGTTANNIVRVCTKEIGQYFAGSEGQFGAGMRIPTLPTTTQFAEWGYDSAENGFGFGVDSTGTFIYSRDNSVQTKVYQASWNRNTLIGTLDLSKGNIYQIDFTWYGYGDIRFYILVNDGTTMVRTLVHRLKIDSQASIVDPNQPIRFYTSNGITSTSNFDVYVGGHHYSVIGGENVCSIRSVNSLLTLYTTATNTNWQPVLAVRKKATFRGRPNSINIKVSGFLVSADGDLQVRLTKNGITSNLAWTTPLDWPSTETACEVKTTSGGTPLTTSSSGFPLDYALLSGTNNQTNSNVATKNNIVLGEDTEIILWVRRYSAAGAIVVNSAVIEWTECW